MIALRARKPASKAMTVAGIMSGTSADGIDVALVRITPGDHWPRLKLLAHDELRFTKLLRSAVLSAMDAKAISTAELARLNWHLGMAYSEAIKQALIKHPMRI